MICANLLNELVAALEVALKRCGSCDGSGIAYTRTTHRIIGD